MSRAILFLLVTVSLYGQLSIKEFGAVGDGLTDDTASIQAAHNSACSTGQALFYPEGKYSVSPLSGQNKATFLLCDGLSVTWRGTVIVKDNAGDFFTLYAPAPVLSEDGKFVKTGSCNNCTFLGVLGGGVDTAAARNSRANIEIATATTSAQNIIYIVDPSSVNLSMSKMTMVGGGINSVVMTVHDVQITDNVFVFSSGIAKGTQKAYDNSFLYITAETSLVEGNEFQSTELDLAVCAMEMHDGKPILKNNYVNWYSTAANLVAGPWADATVEFANNNVKNTRLSVSMWSLSGRTFSGIITSNQINVNQWTRKADSSWGIATYEDATITGAFDQVSISDNVISFEKEQGGRSVAPASNYCIGFQANGNIQNANVLNNTCNNAPVRGIVVGNGYGQKVTNVQVEDNTLNDTGWNAQTISYNAGIVLWGNLSNVSISNNNQTFVNAPHSTFFAASYETLFTRVLYDLTSNTVSAVGALPLNGLSSSVNQYSPRTTEREVCRLRNLTTVLIDCGLREFRGKPGP